MRERMTKIAATAALALLAGIGPARAADLASWQQKVDTAVLEAAAAGEADFLIYMTEQADLSGAAALRGKAAKAAYVYAQKTALARDTQAPLLAALDGLGAWHRSFWIVNLVHARGGLAVVEAAAARADVAHVYENSLGMLDPPVGAQSTAAAAALDAAQWNLAITNADDVWALGITGQGVVVAGADTGVEWQHPALLTRYRGWDGAAADHDYNWHDAIHTPNTECAGSSPEPCDDDALLGGGHGTHTVGTMVGDDGGANRTGMAPGAQWMACRNMHYGVGVVATYLECMEWFLAPTDVAGNDPDPAKSPHVINNSWACVEVCPPTILQDGTEAIRAAGIVYVAAAGNDGRAGCNTIAFPPAIYHASLTVGATDANDNVASFSSRGPVLTLDPLHPHRKPDVSAPGSGVRSAVKGGGYANLSGTSMAAPHVAGLVALLISANPDLAGDVDAIEEIIERSAFPRTTSQGCGGDTPTQVPNNVYGHGRIDALAAVQEAIRLRRSCAEVDDSDPAVEYRGGWHLVEDADASAGGYHRRMGSKNGPAPVARLVFEGDEVTYRFATSKSGGTADVYLDGVLRQTLSYAGTAPHGDPAFDGAVSFGGLAAGSHELRVEHRSGAANVDGFTVCGPGGGAADASAAAYRSETQVSRGSSPLGVVERTVQVGAMGEELSVVVEGALAAPTVRLLDPTGTLLASGGALLPGLTAAGTDAAASSAGSYTVQVLTAPGSTVTISTVRTVRE